MPRLKSGTAAAVVAAGFLLACAVMVAESFTGSGALQSRVKYAMGPAFFPRIVLGLLVLMALATTVQEMRRISAPARFGRVMAVIGMMSATGAYIWLIGAIGFLFASIAYSIVCPVILGYRRWGVLVLLGIVYAVVVWYVFHRVLQIILPASPWFAYF